MRILMVGTGAVGQVFGLHLANSGIELAFYARPESALRLRQAYRQDGLPLSRVSHLRRRGSVEHLRDYTVVTDTAESQAFDPDQIWFATPSSVYHSEWFRDFLRDVPAERVVCFPPEGERRDMIPQQVSTDRVVFGGITFVAWQGDLDGGGGRADGVNFWLPPGLSIPLMGPRQACAGVAEVLNRAGLRSDVQSPAYRHVQAAVTAVMTTFVAGLELAGWSFKAFRRGPWHRHAAGGAREAVLGQLPDLGAVLKALLKAFLSPVGFSLTTLGLPIVFPIDVQAYLRFHFTKTRDQTLDLLELFAEDTRHQGIPVVELESLRQALLAADTPD